MRNIKTFAPLLVAAACGCMDAAPEEEQAKPSQLLVYHVQFDGPAFTSPIQATDMWQAYDVLDDGTGVIGIVEPKGYARAKVDLDAFRQAIGLSSLASNLWVEVDQSGGTNFPTFDLTWAQETAAMLDAATVICPGCKIVLVHADSAGVSDLATAVDQAITQGAKSIGAGWTLAPSAASTLESHFTGAASNVRFAFTSGNGGYSTPVYPALSARVSAIGTTGLTSNAMAPRGYDEGVLSTSGSGCDTGQSQPSQQVTPVGNACNGRLVVDFGMIGAQVAVRLPTSSSAAANSTIDAPAFAVGGALGAIARTTLTSVQLYAHTGAFFDIPAGTSNGSCSHTLLCDTKSGFDGPTGLGAVDIDAISQL